MVLLLDVDQTYFLTLLSNVYGQMKADIEKNEK